MVGDVTSDGDKGLVILGDSRGNRVLLVSDSFVISYVAIETTGFMAGAESVVLEACLQGSAELVVFRISVVIESQVVIGWLAFLVDSAEESAGWEEKGLVEGEGVGVGSPAVVS